MAVVEHVESGDAAAEHRHEIREQAPAEFLQRVGALQRSREARHTRLYPALLVHRRSALLEHVDGARQAAGLVRCVREWHRLVVVTRGNRLDRGVEGADRFHDPADGQKPQHASQHDGRRVRHQDSPSRCGDGLDGGSARGVGELLVDSNPLAGGGVQPLAHVHCLRVSQQGAGVFRTPGGRERHDLIRAVQPDPVLGAIVVQQAAILIVGDQSALVVVEQAAKHGFVPVERRLYVRALCVARREHVIPDVDSKLGERSRDVAERREAGDLQVRYEPALGLDRRQLQPCKDANGDQRQDRHGQQQDQAFGNRHKDTFTGPTTQCAKRTFRSSESKGRRMRVESL